MISNFRFGRAKWVKKEVGLYVYHNLSESALINLKHDWLPLPSWDVEASISHETLHKVFFKLEGRKVSTALDKWCKSRDWLFQDNSGICFNIEDLTFLGMLQELS